MIMNRQQPAMNQGAAPYSFQGAAPVYPTYQAPTYQAPTFQAASAHTPPPSTAFPSGMTIPTGGPAAAQPVFEESYIENILRLNLGKVATVYMTFENNNQWNAKVFKGRLEAAGRDHIILSDPTTGMRYLLLMINLDYVTFDEELNYEYPGHIPGTGR